MLKGQLDVKILAKALAKYNASDLHIKEGRPPLFRVHGKLVPAKVRNITGAQIKDLLETLLTPQRKNELEVQKQVDFSFEVGEMGRFRCNVYFQKGGPSLAIRRIPSEAPHLDRIGMPPVLKELCQRDRGLILVTGVTGAGKSTTLSAMVRQINETRPVHVLTVEDPIECLHQDIRASVTQREIGSDVRTMAEAVVAGLRQDPDIIVIGEIRDPLTIQAALTAAATGHLVITTLHTIDARASVERIVDVFPSEAQGQVRIQLASALLAVVSQRLVPRASGSGSVAACEVMVKSPTIENLILKNQTAQIPEAIANSKNYYKMQTLNQALERLVKEGLVLEAEALKASNSPDDLKLLLSGFNREQGYLDIR